MAKEAMIDQLRNLASRSTCHEFDDDDQAAVKWALGIIERNFTVIPNEVSFDLIDGFVVRVVNDGDRLSVRGINNGPLYLNALTILPHGDNVVTIKPRARSEVRG